MSCTKLFSSSYKSTVSHTRHDRSVDRQTAAAAAQPEIGAAERKDLLPWPIKTRKRGSSSNPNRAGKEEVTWGFTDLPPKKRILMAVQARGVDRFMCVVCGRVFEDYKSQLRKQAPDDSCPESDEERCWGSGDHRRRYCKVLPAFDREEATPQDLPWYGMNA